MTTLSVLEVGTGKPMLGKLLDSKSYPLFVAENSFETLAYLCLPDPACPFAGHSWEFL